MSLLLDERLVGECAEYCPAQFLKFYDCLGQGDAELCLQEQKSLSACVKAKAPKFKKIVSACADHMQAYEDCIKRNPEFRTQCFDELTEVRKCVARVVPSDNK